MSRVWKDNWEETKDRFRAWWRHEGLVFGAWGPGLPIERSHEPVRIQLVTAGGILRAFTTAIATIAPPVGK